MLERWVSFAAGPPTTAVKYRPRTHNRPARWPAGSSSMKPQPHFLTIRWEVLAEDGATITMQATLCKFHRQAIALEFPSAQGIPRQFGLSCDLCESREPRTL